MQWVHQSIFNSLPLYSLSCSGRISNFGSFIWHRLCENDQVRISYSCIFHFQPSHTYLFILNMKVEAGSMTFKLRQGCPKVNEI